MGGNDIRWHLDAVPEPVVTDAPDSPRLRSGEQLLARFEPDLDDAMRFAPGQLLLTTQRLLAFTDGCSWQGWELHAGLRLQQSDHAGIATLVLSDGQRPLARWRFTLACEASAGHFLRSVERQLAHAPVRATGDDNSAPLGAAAAEPKPLEAVSHRVLLRLWRFARPHRGSLLLGLLLTLAATAAALVPPYLSMPLMDQVLIPAAAGQPLDFPRALRYLGGLLAAALLAWGLGWWRTYLLALVSERIGADLRMAAFDHLMSLSLDYFGTKRTGDLIARISSESDRICLFLSLHALDFLTDMLLLAMTSVVLFTINPWLTLVTLLPLPVILWMIHRVRERMGTGFEKIDRFGAELNNVLADTIPGIRVVKAFAQERRESQRFLRTNRAYLQANDRLNRTWALFGPTVTLLTELGLLVVWAFGIWLVMNEAVTVGVLVAFIAYIGRFYGRLDAMSRIVSHTQKAAAAAKRIFDILDHQSSVPEPASPALLPAVPAAIGLHGVGFRHGSRRILKDISLEIRPGEMIGLVGLSGSGKSTLMNLICRFHDVSEGMITLGGTDIRQFAIADYRRRIGLVLQEPFLFHGTVAENIAYGRPEASRAEIVAAARAAHAHEFILRLRHGYDSIVGERGQGLSGGERQRISIARALLIDPPVLMLDEATSSLDSQTEKDIQRALDNLVRGRTTIAIAHRLSTLSRADRLVVLEQGEIVECGSHQELMAARGSYWKLYQAQQRHAVDALDDARAAACGRGR